MADILIRGMEMPTEEEISKCIIIRYDGEVWIVEFDNLVEGGFVACYPTNPMRAVPLPEGHGRLGDLDALMPDFVKARWAFFSDGDTFLQLLKHAPTIVPAEGGEADGD